MRSYLLPALILNAAWLFFSCNGSRDEIKILAKEVITVHDEVMPKMGVLHQLKKQMVTLRDSLVENESSDSLIYQEHITNLEEAGDEMMEWMHAYQVDLSKYTTEEAMTYLKEEKRKIVAVKEKMNNAIEVSKNARSYGK